MFLKLIRHKTPWGQLQRGTLYTVHFQPNEKGGYNETQTPICDAYELPHGDVYPLPLIYPAEVRRVKGHMRLAFGRGDRYSLLHLIDRDARNPFFTELLRAIRCREDVRIEITN